MLRYIGILLATLLAGTLSVHAQKQQGASAEELADTQWLFDHVEKTGRGAFLNDEFRSVHLTLSFEGACVGKAEVVMHRVGSDPYDGYLSIDSSCALPLNVGGKLYEIQGQVFGTMYAVTGELIGGVTPSLKDGGKTTHPTEADFERAVRSGIAKAAAAEKKRLQITNR